MTGRSTEEGVEEVQTKKPEARVLNKEVKKGKGQAKVWST